MNRFFTYFVTKGLVVFIALASCIFFSVACLKLFSQFDSLRVSSVDESSVEESVVEETTVDESVSDLPVFEQTEFDILNGIINHIYVWTDEETGVQYIIYHEKCGYAGFGGITPRLNPDGSLYVVSDDLK